MIRQKTIKITIVVEISIIHGPTLFVQDESPFFGGFGIIVVPIIDPQLVNSTRIEWITYKLTTLGDGQIKITVLVKITPNGSIVATMICRWIIAEVIIGQIEKLLVVVQSRSIS